MDYPKSDTSTMAYKDFAQIRSCLNILSAERVEYMRDTTTMVILGVDFIRIMHYLESLILQLFGKNISTDQTF